MFGPTSSASAVTSKLKMQTGADIEKLRRTTQAEGENLRVCTKADIEALRLGTKADIETTSGAIASAKVDTVRWIFGAIGFQTVALLGAIITLARIRPR